MASGEAKLRQDRSGGARERVFSIGASIREIAMAESRSAGEDTAQEGESSSKLDDLYRANADAALRLAYVLTGDREAANDLVQEAFVRVLGRFGQLRHRDSFEPYLRRTVVNLAATQLRRRSVERRFLERWQEEGPPTGEMPDIETRHELWQLLLGLPARQRIAVVLRYYEDMSEHEAGEAMGVSARAINSLVSRALDELRRKEGSRG
jgi:RNA polymerase sigma-70 factor (sigma-E family)